LVTISEATFRTNGAPQAWVSHVASFRELLKEFDLAAAAWRGVA
jgi:hypothetical protein